MSAGVEVEAQSKPTNEKVDDGKKEEATKKEAAASEDAQTEKLEIPSDDAAKADGKAADGKKKEAKKGGKKKPAKKAAAEDGEDGEDDDEDGEDGKKTKLCDYCCAEIPAKATRCRFCSSMLSKKTLEESDFFTVIREETQSSEETIFNQKYSRTFLLIVDDGLKQTLRCFMNNNPVFFEKEAKISADELFTVLPTLRQNDYTSAYDTQPNAFHSLVQWLDKEFEEQSKKYEDMKKEGVMTFESLQYIFPRATKFWGMEGEHKIGSEVAETQYVRNLLSTYFVINGEVIKSKGDKFFSINHQFAIPAFKGAKKIAELPVQPMTDEILKELEKRGEKFNKIGINCHHLVYKGKMLYKTPYGQTSWKADGRIMIDGTSFNKMNPNYTEFISDNMRNYGYGNNPNESGAITEIPQEAWYKTWYTVGGFSFTAKKWGEIIVDYTQDIVFDDTAFTRLVLPQNKKNLIKSLILNTDNAFADIITGKGAGCIFLLHGPPGVGKTLTAEAIAELLHRPLYSISVGELGTETDFLETRLRDILDVASVWDSVILIDEADIFLERRQDSDIHRNAMVGIFLRLLEYHQGILFLTTNRVKRFDEAFHSRISVALKYDELDEAAREKVWRNFIEVANLGKDIDGKKLSQHKLNGRQIRTTIRLALALAKTENVPVTMEHFDATIKVAKQFQQDMVEIGEEEKQASIRKSQG